MEEERTVRVMIRVMLGLFVLIWLMFMVRFAWAQTTISVDIAKAKLVWDWTQGTGGLVGEFRAKCGNITGSYSVVTVIVDPAQRMVPIKMVITEPGKWFCVVTAANEFGESAPSNEVNFAAGVVPVSPANNRVQAQ